MYIQSPYRFQFSGFKKKNPKIILRDLYLDLLAYEISGLVHHQVRKLTERHSQWRGELVEPKQIEGH